MGFFSKILDSINKPTTSNQPKSGYSLANIKVDDIQSMTRVNYQTIYDYCVKSIEEQLDRPGEKASHILQINSTQYYSLMSNFNDKSVNHLSDIRFSIAIGETPKDPNPKNMGYLIKKVGVTKPDDYIFKIPMSKFSEYYFGKYSPGSFIHTQNDIMFQILEVDAMGNHIKITIPVLTGRGADRTQTTYKQILYLLPPKECCITTVEKGKVVNTIPKPNELKPIDSKKNVTETSQVKENISNTASIIKEQNKPHKVLQSIDAIGFGETSQKSKQNIPTEGNIETSSVGDIAH